MTPTILPPPDWLTRRDGTVKPGIRPDVLFVMIAGAPQYRLEVRPANGQYTCAVVQTVNGRHLGDDTTYASPDAALAGGLEQLRAKLGW